MLGSHIENYILAKQICIRSVLAQSWPNDFPGHKTKAGNRVEEREREGEKHSRNYLLPSECGALENAN